MAKRRELKGLLNKAGVGVMTQQEKQAIQNVMEEKKKKLNWNYVMYFVTACIAIGILFPAIVQKETMHPIGYWFLLILMSVVLLTLGIMWFKKKKK